MPETLVYILLAIVLLAAGGAAGFWLGQKRGREDAARSTDVQKEFDAYRQQVSEHFAGTADHFQALGKQVRHLYDHMAEGADKLCSEEAAGQAIEFSAAGALTGAAADAGDAGKQPEEPETSAEKTAMSGDGKAEAKDADTGTDGEEPEAGTSADGGPPKDYEAGDEKVKRVETADAGASFTVAGDEEDPGKRSYH